MYTFQGKRRMGFTLVELLVVIVIIAILAGLATPAIMIAVEKAKVTAMRLELNALAQGIELYRNEYGEYPPDFSDLNAVLRHLNRVHPRRQEYTTISDFDVNNQNSPFYQFDQAQAIVFWLRGYYPNPAYPITGNGQGSRQAVMEFSVKMLARNDKDDDLDLDTPGEVLVHSQNGQAPIVYFDSRSTPGSTRSYEVAGQPKVYSASGVGTIEPYMDSRTFPLGPNNWEYINPKSFQLISAGRDNQFGAGQGQVKWFPTGNGYEAEDHDNLAHFTNNPLGDAIE